MMSGGIVTIVWLIEVLMPIAVITDVGFVNGTTSVERTIMTQNDRSIFLMLTICHT